MLPRILNRRALYTPAVAAATSIGSVSGVSLAQGTDGGRPGARAVRAQTAASPAGGILASVHDILAGLVSAGTVTPTQADAVQAQADAGSIDPKELVQNGVLNDAQMRTVGNRIDQLKRSHGR